jgi:hypothetical protein
MIIQCDDEGMKTVRALIDAGIKTGQFGNAESVIAVLNAVKPIEEPKQARKKGTENDAVDQGK